MNDFGNWGGMAIDARVGVTFRSFGFGFLILNELFLRGIMIWIGNHIHNHMFCWWSGFPLFRTRRDAGIRIIGSLIYWIKKFSFTILQGQISFGSQKWKNRRNVRRKSQNLNQYQMIHRSQRTKRERNLGGKTHPKDQKFWYSIYYLLY